MTIDKKFTPKENPSTGLNSSHIHSFLHFLQAEGYADRTLRKKKSVVASFVRWTVEKELTVHDLHESHLTAFVERQAKRTKDRVNFERAALQPFFTHLTVDIGRVRPALLSRDSLEEIIQQRYSDYLRNERGLTENSLRVYLPLINDFLNAVIAKWGRFTPEALDAQTVQEFLLKRIRNRSSEYARLLATALRSFLRFLFIREETPVDLSLCVPTVRRWQESKIHGFLTPDEVDHIISAIDLSTSRGRRDRAILLFLARLGLRASEIVFMELEDIRWHTGEIIIRGKGRVNDCLPMLSDIGEALALYLTQERGGSRSRRVFLRMLTPRIGLSGPAAVDHIVRHVLARVGLRAPKRRVAHLFRHSLATTMIHHGASIMEISKILRHRSQSTTQIYTQLDFETLRAVARPWPRKKEVSDAHHP
jgi:integrase/recombinase XerD